MLDRLGRNGLAAGDAVGAVGKAIHPAADVGLDRVGRPETVGGDRGAVDGDDGGRGCDAAEAHLDALARILRVGVLDDLPVERGDVQARRPAVDRQVAQRTRGIDPEDDSGTPHAGGRPPDQRRLAEVDVPLSVEQQVAGTHRRLDDRALLADRDRGVERRGAVERPGDRGLVAPAEEAAQERRRHAVPDRSGNTDRENPGAPGLTVPGVGSAHQQGRLLEALVVIEGHVDCQMRPVFGLVRDERIPLLNEACHAGTVPAAARWAERRAVRAFRMVGCVADMTKTVRAADPVLADREHARALLRMMMLIRRFEERTEEQYTRARIGGYCHLAIGEEAANVGILDVLGDDDYVFTSYRDHATALAIGSPPAGVMAELFGKASGVAGGYGGSMHLLDVERRFLGGWGIVGGQLPIAVGAALALDYEERAGIVVCQLGDGATNTGAFHESLNLAAIWKLPVVFQVINNGYGMGTSVGMASAETELWKRAAAYEMHGERVDGNDVLAVREAAVRLVEMARVERRPSLLETVTYRHRGHSVADAGKVYRTQDEIDSWRRQDPIDRFRVECLRAGILDSAGVEDLRDDVEEEISLAIREAASGPNPDPANLYDHVYRDEAVGDQFARMNRAAPFGEREETRAWQR